MKTPVLLLALSAAVFFSAASNAEPSQIQKVQPGLTKAKVVTRLTAQQTLSIPGDKKTVQATLTRGTTNAPIPGKKVHFSFVGKEGGKDTTIPIGEGTTDANGLAKSEKWEVPELDQGPGKLVAQWDGDDELMGTKDDATFGIVPGSTHIVLDDLIWGQLDAHGGPSFATIIIHVRRDVDNRDISAKVDLTVNGSSNTIGPGLMQIVLTPTNAHHWDVDATFKGSASYQGTSKHRAYNH